MSASTPPPPKQKKQKVSREPLVVQPQKAAKKSPPVRRMIPVLNQPITMAKGLKLAPTPAKTFSIMTYNILAQCLVRRTLFPYCTKDDLKFASRFPKILKELSQTHTPDIACLQEVDCFDSHVAPRLRSAGYDWVYMKKGKDMDKESGHGLCIAWKKSRFTKHKYAPVSYDSHPLTHPTPITPTTNNIAQILALKFTAEPHPDPFFLETLDTAERLAYEQKTRDDETGIIVANTHLYWRPTGMYEKLRQSWVLSEEVDAFRKGLEESWPCFVAGDFNSVPSDGVYRTLTKQPLTSVHHEKFIPVPIPPKTPKSSSSKSAEAAPTAAIDTSKETLIDALNDTRSKAPPSTTNDSSADASTVDALPADASSTPSPAEPNLESPFQPSDPPVNPLPPSTLIAKFLNLPAWTSLYSTYRTSDLAHTINPTWVDGLACFGGETWEGEPTYTNFAIWKGTLDYIFLVDDVNKLVLDGGESSEGGKEKQVEVKQQEKMVVQVHKVLEIPHAEDLEPGLPNSMFGSDHVAVMAEVGLYKALKDDVV